jgi:hypothetical protein
MTHVSPSPRLQRAVRRHKVGARDRERERERVRERERKREEEKERGSTRKSLILKVCRRNYLLLERKEAAGAEQKLCRDSSSADDAGSTNANRNM